MTRRIHHFLTSLSVVAATLLVAAPALADDGPSSVSVSTIDGQTRILVAWDDGVVVFDDQGVPYHQYRFKPKSKGGPHHAVADINADGHLDYIAMGPKLTFAISGSGDPIWGHEGCDMARLGNIAGEASLEVFCVDGRNMRVWDADGNVVWELEVSGMKFSDCRLVDLRGAGMGDIECQLKGNKTYLQISGEGSLISDAAEAPSDAEPQALPPLKGSVLPGAGPDGEDVAFDFNGDGTAEELLVLDGGDALVQMRGSDGKPLAVAPLTPTAATAADLDGDGDQEVILVSDNRIVALDRQADKTVRFDNLFERSSLSRKPLVEYGTVGGYNVTGDEAALRELLAPAIDAMAACYTRRIDKDPFLKVGRLSIRADVDATGKVTGVKQSFSTVDDADVESCIEGVIGGLTLLPPTEGADEAYVSIDIVLAYRDR